jgi:hypothetical protein
MCDSCLGHWQLCWGLGPGGWGCCCQLWAAQFGTKVWAAEVGSAALVKTQRNALILCLSP